MSILYVLLPVALLMGTGFLLAFIWMSFTGQYDDLDTPAYRVLLDDESPTPTARKEIRNVI